MRNSIFLVLFAILASSPARALIPEGLESLINDDTPNSGSGTGYLNAQLGYVKPDWTQDYEVIQGYASLATPSGNYFTFGAEVTAANTFANRDAYFLRYDQTFSGQSVSFKFAHQDLNFISAGKNVFSIDYNNYSNFGSAVLLYISIGVYERFNLNSWNSPTWDPLNWNTDDRDSFLDVCFGSKVTITPAAFVTMDINNRDPFLPYNGDDLAVDFTFSLVTSKSLTWRIIESNRFSGFMMGTGDLSELTILAGVVAPL